MNVLSLFSGIGGLELGLERAGMTTVGQVELDPYCRTVLEHHWPEVPRHDDVRTAPAWWRAQPRPAVDLVAGGFPCQPFSQAGRRNGIADERWGWPWMLDVLDAVRPRYVLAENVAALLRDTEAFSIILSDLSDLGFDVEWSVVSACSVGAPHLRRRLFILAHPRGQGLQGLHGPGRSIDLRPAQGPVRRHWPTEPAVARMADGVPRRLVRDPLRALGNAVVPAVTEQIGHLIVRAANEVPERRAA
ncbi:DNA cytosine methyltransferase [Amycolatopsis sp. YIM 10]|uniref:DNA cytosine methyltransferase n=1 Tax=Amycolatopsis sp. YIM 10 TaxID=2653857 RepID=UPI001290028E|nr:DNA (cytosine-5-)-methyltransferase [Amycolatopsis sp. YIM 10]QFU94086.1 putative BsuMI modification methylase subunit YdiP [Amycolatopsis sp. YIM 10]